MRISDWSSDVCSSDLAAWRSRRRPSSPCCSRTSEAGIGDSGLAKRNSRRHGGFAARAETRADLIFRIPNSQSRIPVPKEHQCAGLKSPWSRSEEHTSEIQSLMRLSYAVFCLKKKKHK